MEFAGVVRSLLVSVLCALPLLSVAQPSTDSTIRQLKSGVNAPDVDRGRTQQPWAGSYWIKDPDPSVRSKAVFSLAQSSPLSSIPELSKMVLDDPSVEVRINAARALGQIARPEAEPAVLEVMGTTDLLPVKYELIKALGSFHTVASADRLVRELNNSGGTVRIAALESIGRRAEPKFVPAVTKFVNDADPTVAGRAIWALGEVGDARATAVLIAKLKGSSSPVLRRESALALGRIGDPSSASALSQSALSKREEIVVRVAAVKALYRMNPDQKTWGDLAMLTKDPEPQMRAASAFAVVKNPIKDGGSSIEALLYDSHPGVRVAAVDAMGLQPGRFATQLSAVGANKGMPLEVRVSALTALGDLSPQELARKPVLDELVKLLDKADAETTQIAAINLLNLTEDASVKGELRRYASEKGLAQSVRDALNAATK
jgi:HEAT repeat protein